MENTNKNHPIAISVHTYEPISEPTPNTISIEEPTLYEINPHRYLLQIENDMNLRTLQMTMMGNEIEDFLKVEIYGRAVIVQLLTISDIVFLTLNIIVSLALQNVFYLFSVLCPLCICGYYGTTNYNKNYLCGYIFYLFLMNIFYLLLFLHYSNFLLLLFCFAESYFLFYTFRLYHCLGRAKEETIESLRNDWEPIIIQIFYY